MRYQLDSFRGWRCQTTSLRIAQSFSCKGTADVCFLCCCKKETAAGHQKRTEVYLLQTHRIYRIESEEDVEDDILLELSELSICLFENCKSRHRDFWGVEANSFRHSRAPDQLKQRGLLGVEACVKTCRDGGVSDPKETLRHYVIVLYIYIHIIFDHFVQRHVSPTA